MFYIYILFSQDADLHYVGHTNAPEERLKQHNNNSTDKFTGKYSDWKMLALFQCGEARSEAMKIEKFIKKQKSKKMLLKLIDPDFTPTGELAQLVRVPNVRD